MLLGMSQQFFALNSECSRQQILSAISIWLQQHDETPSASSFPMSTHPSPVPMVYSNEHWFELAISPLCAEIVAELDKEDCSEAHICRMLLFIQELITRVGEGYCARTRMTEFLKPLKHLLQCAEKPAREQTRRLAQNAFASLLDRFEVIAQFLLLSHLFQLVFARQITLSEEIYEPQVLAFLVDIFRQKCFSSTANSECDKKHIFQSQLGHFYSQLAEVVYEDPLAAINFYTAVLLLVTAQAIHRCRIPLLKCTGRSLVAKYRTQLRDWMELKQRREGKEEGKKQERKEFDGNNDTMPALLEKRQKSEKREMERMQLAMFSFQLEEAEERVAAVLKQI